MLDHRERKRKRLSGRKPAWLRSDIPSGENYVRLKKLLKERNLHTICEEGKCPNLAECWGGGTATFMLLGDICTRGCRFCNVMTRKHGIEVDTQEPYKVAEASVAMDLDYVVITSVDRDDLPDGGANHFADTIRKVYELSENSIMVEVLTPDFRGKREDIATVVAAKPTVFSHNMETVRSLTPKVRDPRCSFDQSLEVLRYAKEVDADTITKSSLMLGLGETKEDVLAAMDDLREAGVDILTLGQYLQPTTKHVLVSEFVPPSRFDELAEEGRKRGFVFVAAGPLVRSSYRAGELFIKNFVEQRNQERMEASS
ncbi:MAG: lipoyl synthase [Deltaproteobacteria bacterium]|nr:MAG: lipoyl synthase [Deltaproteobacteria bacterium]